MIHRRTLPRRPLRHSAARAAMADAAVLMAEYAPRPPFRGGTLGTALTESTTGFVAQARMLRSVG